ncbi:MAG: hypothetical protein JWP63_4581 [Candidatus Solibacter sp.]|jgi:thioester reductase-like protein|nr:hypothetical protein [Candidatus Solibacter sp.]
MPKYKLSAVLSLMVVFLSGSVLGAVAYRLYAVSSVQGVRDVSPKQPKMSPEEFRKHYVEEFRTKVKMDDQQVAALQQILDQTRSDFHKMRDKMNAEGDAIQNAQVEKINSILREDQRPLYATLRAEREKQRKLRDEQRKKDKKD